MDSRYFVIFLIFLLNYRAHAFYPNGTLLVPPPKDAESLEDFEHQFKGCPENSECDSLMGQRLLLFKDLIQKMVDEEAPEKKRALELNKFRTQFGLPVEFYTIQKSFKEFKPLLYNSPCPNHNPKKKSETQTLIGKAFIKSTAHGKAMVIRGQTQLDVPLGDLLRLQPLEVFYDKAATTYQIPIGEKPLFIKDKSLYLLKEEDNFFYFLKISAAGDWSVEEVDATIISRYQDKISDITCPAPPSQNLEVFKSEYCQNVWSEDLKKTVVFRVYRGCVL